MVGTTTGAQTIWAFVFEDELEYAQEPGTPTDTTFKPFGDREEINEPSSENNTEALYRPFERNPSNYIEGRFEGSGGVDFIYTNPYWLAFIMGQPSSTDDGSGTFTSNYEFLPDRPPASAHIIEETHYANGDVKQTVYIGSIATGMDIDVSTDDVVEISFDWDYADERHYDTASTSPIGEIGSQPSTKKCPLHFGNADLLIDLDNDSNAERQGKVQSVSFSFNVNAEVETELGTRKGTEPTFLEVEPDISYQKYLGGSNPEQERRSVYGSQAQISGEDYYAPLEELCDSDANIAGRIKLESRSETNSLEILFGESIPESYTRSNTGDPQSAIEDDVDRNVYSITATATTDYDPSV